MNPLRLLLPLPALAVLAAGPPPQGTLDVAVNDADLRDVLRAVTAGTDLSLVFEPGLAARVQGLDLKGASLQDVLDLVLPGLGLAATRNGRSLYIHRREQELRFFHVDLLALSRTGTKTFQVNGSGQVAQAGLGGAYPAPGGSGGLPGTNGNGVASAYTSSVQEGLESDPWADLESGLMLLVFGQSVERQPAPAPRAGQGTGGPGSRGYAADGKSLLIQPNAGLVAVGADPATLERVTEFLAELRSRSQRQVLLEAKIVEVTLGSDSQVGVDWNAVLGSRVNPTSVSLAPVPGVLPPGGLLQVVVQTQRVTAALNALARDNRLKVLTAPRLATLNNQKAILRVVSEQVYGLPSSQITPGTAAGGAVATTQIAPLVVPVGIILDIQPQIGDDGVITLAVDPSISDVASVQTLTAPGPTPGSTATLTLPVVTRRDLDAIVRVRSGETLVLAGIIRTQEQAANSGVPWLRKLPLVGALFSGSSRTRTRTELAIFITPTLMDQPGQVAAAAGAAEHRLDSAGIDLQPAPPNPRPEPKEP